MNMTIPYCKSYIAPNSEKYVIEALSHKTSGDGKFTKRCTAWLEEHTGTVKALLTTSCSHALDMAAHLCGINKGDEVIMSSFTFPSTANAFVGQGAKMVFVDIRPDTMNIDETLIEAAITGKTRAIVPVHYAGISCEMDAITEIANKHNLVIVEDAAQGIMADYKGKPLGSMGDFGCFSFHDTKNFSMGEGGALLICDSKNIPKAEVIREKGTDRSRFYRGEVDKYSWVDWGSSYLPSELNAAYLWSQLEIADEINNARLVIWNKYYKSLRPLSDSGILELPYIPQNCRHNAHIFYIKVNNNEVQSKLLRYLQGNGMGAVFHYVPLHSSQAGQKYGSFHGEDRFTTKESSRLVRLPIYVGMTDDDTDKIVDAIYAFFK